MGEQRRIFVGTVEIARQVHTLAAAFRALGHHVTSAVTRRSPFYPDLDYDLVLEETAAAPPTGRLRRAAHKTMVRQPLLGAMRGHDLFVFQFGDSALPCNLDYPVLARAGKRIVSLFQGSDIRHWSATEQARAAAGLSSYAGYQQGRSLLAALMTLRMAELYGTVTFAQPSYAELAMAPYMHLYLAVDLSLYDHRVPGREVPVVVHAPSSRTVKGTAELLVILDGLRADGVAFDLRLLEGLPNRDVLRELTDSDVVLDELNECNYGMLALEAMASGCAVAGGNRPDVVPLPTQRPVVHISPENAADRLRRLLTDRQYRVQVAVAGRPFVRNHHDHIEVARCMLAAVDGTTDGQRDYRPRFFVEEYGPPPGTQLCWPPRYLTRRVAKKLGLPDADLARLASSGLV